MLAYVGVTDGNWYRFLAGRPAVAELAQHYGVARNTVMKALRRLAEDGLVEIVPNWGTFRARN